jgi:hypothetical protein
MGHCKIVVNFWHQGHDRHVVLAFEGAGEVTTTLPGNVSLRVDLGGVTRVDHCNAHAFVTNPTVHLEEVGRQAAARMASEITGTVSWFGMELGSITGSLESIYHAHQYYESSAWQPFVEALMTGDWILPEFLQTAVDYWREPAHNLAGLVLRLLGGES